uniref:Reverse transcriptase n=1 Tax=Heterorhabditis bacteriophora TaxID=37862 RepID=A0A1I7WG84_HETBA
MSLPRELSCRNLTAPDIGMHLGNYAMADSHHDLVLIQKPNYLNRFSLEGQTANAVHRRVCVGGTMLRGIVSWPMKKSMRSVCQVIEKIDVILRQLKNYETGIKSSMIRMVTKGAILCWMQSHTFRTDDSRKEDRRIDHKFVKVSAEEIG